MGPYIENIYLGPIRRTSFRPPLSKASLLPKSQCRRQLMISFNNLILHFDDLFTVSSPGSASSSYKPFSMFKIREIFNIHPTEQFYSHPTL